MSLWFRRRTITRLAAGELDAAAERRLRGHLAGCTDCRRYYDGLALVAAAAGPGLNARGHERDRLRAALAATTPSAVTIGKAPLIRPARQQRLGLRLALVAAPALGAIVLLAAQLRPSRAPTSSPGPTP